MTKHFLQWFLVVTLLVVTCPQTTTATSSVRRLELNDSPTPPTTTAAARACASKPRQSDITAGVDLITDMSCSAGGVGCLGTNCRYCQRWETVWSRELVTCRSIEGGAQHSDATKAAPESTRPPLPAQPVSVGLQAVVENGSSLCQLSVGIAAGVAAAIAIVAVVATKFMRRGARDQDLPTPTSLAYHRTSVFQI